MLTPDTLLNERYRIVRQIGQGGMGAVYEAVDQRLRARVALKQTTVSGEQLRRAFEREAQLLAGLRHPVLPHVIDHFITAEGQFLVMDFIAGEDLAAMLKARGAAFPLDQVLAWADQLLDALEYLHGQNPPVVHRDIKPQNLKLTPRGEMILLDFGLAKGSVPLATQAEGAGASVFGYTPQYAPIEQVQGTGTGPRSDLYSLAATLYHLITGQAPADTLTRAEAVLNGKPDPLLPANTLNPAISPVLAGALAQALALRADERFGSAAAMRRALRHAAADTPPASTGPTVVARQPQPAPPPARVEESYRATELPTATPELPAAPTPAKRRGGRNWLMLAMIAFIVVLLLMAVVDGLFSGVDQVAAPTGSEPSAAAGREEQPSPAPAPTEQPAAAAAPTEAEARAQPTAEGLPEAQAITLDARITDEISSPGQSRAYRFAAEPGQQIFVWTADFDDEMRQIKLRLLDSLGDEETYTCLGCGNMGVVTLKKGGTYTLVVGSDSSEATGAFELRVSLVPPTAKFNLPINARIVSGEPGAGAGEIDLPGAKDAYTFDATPGQQVFVWTANLDDEMRQIKLRLLDSLGDEVTYTCLGCGNMGAVDLKKGGSYTLVVGSDTDPASGAYEIRLNAIPEPAPFDVTLPAAIAVDAPAQGAGAINVPGEKQVYRFEASPNQKIFVTTVRFDSEMRQIKLRLLDSLGDEVESTCMGCGNMGAVTLRKGGSYTLVVGSDTDPATGTYEIRIE